MNNELLNSLSNKESEESILASLISEPSRIEDLFIKPEFMTGQANRETLRAIIELTEKGYKIDLVTIMNFVSENKGYDVQALKEKIVELVQTEFLSSNFIYHQNKVVESFRKREQIRALEKASYAIMNGEDGKAYNELMETFEKIETITNSEEDNGHISLVMQRVYESLINSDNNTLSKTHLKNLDALVNWKRQDFNILAARPSMGKTALAMNLAQLHASENKAPVVVFSKEMPNEAVGTRMLSSESRVTMEKMKSANTRLDTNDWNRIAISVAQLGEKKIHMFDNTTMNVSYIRKKAKQIKRLYPEEHMLIVIDYLQLIDSENIRLPKNEQVAEISRELKRIARDLDCTVLALAQLNRNVEQRQDKRPMSSDLGESGSIERDADVIMAIYRDDYYNRESIEPGVTELIVTKNRNGETGVAKLQFMKAISKFIDKQ